jgi:biotin operon repressor
MEHIFTVDKNKYHKAILQIYNFNLKMSDLELDIISTLIANNLSEVNADSKDILRQKLDVSKFMLNNYIKRLKDKGILIPIEDNIGYTINPNIVNLTKDPNVSFEFVVS